MSRPALAIVIAVSCIASLVVGGITGWFGHRAYVAAEMEAAFADLEDELGELDDFDDVEPIDDEAQEDEHETAGPPEGDPTDGQFEYTVTGVETTDTYSDEWCGETFAADGEFAVISVDAENVGDAPGEPASAAYHDVFAYDVDGVQFSAHWDICTFADETNPGNSASYEVVFDVPLETALSVLELGSDTAPGLAVVPVD